MKRFFEKTFSLMPTDGVLTGAVRARDAPETASCRNKQRSRPQHLCAEAYGKIAYRSDDLLIQRRNNESYSTNLS